MGRLKTLVAVVITVIVVVAPAVIYLRNQSLNSQATRTASVTTSVVGAVEVTQKSKVATAKPLYGMTSLNNEEREILRKSFQDDYVVTPDFPTPRLHMAKAAHDAYRMGIICLKHRLNRSEVSKLITDRRLPSDTADPQVLYYQIGPGTLFQIEFTAEGSIKCVQMAFAWYKFPALEDVTPDTPIEPPPMPADWGK
jgi:hypothetical protein